MGGKVAGVLKGRSFSHALSLPNGCAVQVLYFCHPEEAFRPTRDLLLDFSERFVTGHDFSRANKPLISRPSRLQPAAQTGASEFSSSLFSRAETIPTTATARALAAVPENAQFTREPLAQPILVLPQREILVNSN
jgi:hypothetical protein